MTTKTESVARQFRGIDPRPLVHPAGPAKVCHAEPPFNYGKAEWFVAGNGSYLCRDGWWYFECIRFGGGGWYATEAEATFRLQLYQSPREALQPFLDANQLEYEGTCGECGGRGEIRQWRGDGGCSFQTCTCHGTGGPPAQHLLAGAADWFEEHGMEMEARVCRDVLGS